MNLTHEMREEEAYGNSSKDVSARLSAGRAGAGGEVHEPRAGRRAGLHSLLDDGVLRIRFCASGAKVRLNSTDKRLTLEIPKGIDLSIHATSALVKADALSQNDLLIAVLSGDISLGTVTANRVDLSGSSGSIQLGRLSARFRQRRWNAPRPPAMSS